MKRFFALILALSLWAGLCACGGSDTPQPRETTEAPQSTTEPPVAVAVPETTEAPVTVEIQEELYAKSGTLEDGTTFTAYRRGGPDGTKAKLIYDTPEGLHYEEYYDQEGVIEYSISSRSDGSSYVVEYYPSGNIARTRTTEPDGAYLEVHFLDNGYIDGDGLLTSGEGYFQKEISPDGQVKDGSHYRGAQEDGTIWSTEQLEDGTVMRVHCKQNGTMIEAYWHNLDTGRHVADLYYENGMKKSSETRYDRRAEYSLEEYDEDGALKHCLVIQEDGREQEEMFSTSGNCTYLRIQGPGDIREYFADEGGNLERYVHNGTAWEGDAISGEVRQNWETIQPKLN